VDFLTIYTQIWPTVLTQQNIQAGFQATGLVPPCLDRVLSSLTVVRTPSPPATTADNVAWTAETPRTVAQLEQQAQHVRDLLRRQSQSPTSQAIRQLAMNSATILAEENRKPRTASQRQQRKRDQRRQYIARGGALQVRQGQQLAVEAERVVAEGDQAQLLKDVSEHHQRVRSVTFKYICGLNADVYRLPLDKILLGNLVSL
jgi:hypothetical protein